LLEIVTNDPYIPHDSDFSEYHIFYPFLVSAWSSIISTYCLTKDLLIGRGLEPPTDWKGSTRNSRGEVE
jgi:hypothetical protein